MSFLLRFWIKRFTVVFGLAVVALGAVEWSMHGARADLGSVALWAAIAAVAAASMSSYWVHKRSCKV